MFGKKKAFAGELDVSDFDFLADSAEFARLWYGADEGITAIIQPRALGADPGMFGLALMDAARHAAIAYSQAVNISEEEALKRILELFDAERENPTDSPEQIDPEG